MIIGITGSIGGGKGTVVDYLIEKKGFAHYSSSGLLTQILEERGETVDRDGMNRVANELRSASPEGGVPAETYKRYQADGSPKDAIFEALHNVAEVKFVQSIGGIVLGVTANPDIRYERISVRGSVKDNVTKEEFIAQQKREEEGSGDPNKSNIYDALNSADFVIENNGTVEELYEKIEEFLNECSPRIIEKSAWFCLKDRRVLFARSKDVDGTFYLPGGKREGGESDEEALVREVKEETKVDLIPDSIKFASEFIHHAHGKPANVSVVLKGYFADYRGELAANEEIAELAWFTSQDKEKLYGVGIKTVEWLHDKGYID